MVILISATRQATQAKVINALQSLHMAHGVHRSWKATAIGKVASHSLSLRQAAAALTLLRDKGLVVQEGDNWRLTDTGFRVRVGK